MLSLAFATCIAWLALILYIIDTISYERYSIYVYIDLFIL